VRTQVLQPSMARFSPIPYFEGRPSHRHAITEDAQGRPWGSSTGQEIDQRRGWAWVKTRD